MARRPGITGDDQGRVRDQFGTNNLGHLLLTSLLLDLLPDTSQSRVVTLSSNSHKWRTLDFDDLQSQANYTRSTAYARSRLANLMFTLELQRRLSAAGHSTLSVAGGHGHPRVGAIRRSQRARQALQLVTAPLNNPIAEAAKPTLLAATGPGIRSGDYIGPLGRLKFRGDPSCDHPAPQARNTADNSGLWDIGNQLTGASWPSLEGRAATAHR